MVTMTVFVVNEKTLAILKGKYMKNSPSQNKYKYHEASLFPLSQPQG